MDRLRFRKGNDANRILNFRDRSIPQILPTPKTPLKLPHYLKRNLCLSSRREQRVNKLLQRIPNLALRRSAIMRQQPKMNLLQTRISKQQWARHLFSILFALATPSCEETSNLRRLN